MGHYKNNVTLLLLVFLAIISSKVDANFDIALENTDGNAFSIAEYIGTGKWVVLNIWGPRCPPCREEMPELVRFHDEHISKNTMVLAIAIDFPSYGYAKRDEVAQFEEDYLIDFPVLLSDASITEKMNLGRLKGLPTTFIFNPEGELAGKQVGGITQKILEDFIKKLKLQAPGSEQNQKSGDNQTKTRKK